ncbi:MAG: hypothetical protein IT445_05000 [Phycisphaeraceae bacterium]|nr:hypothetical protein [Phycisphaeraceae bacterium]
MKKSLLIVLGICGLIGLALTSVATANSAVDSDEPAMMVSPNVIVLAKVSTVTVHTNIPAVLVVSESIELDGVSPTGLGVDNLGHLVAKFVLADLALQPGPATLILSGDFMDGGSFSATDDVMVK